MAFYDVCGKSNEKTKLKYHYMHITLKYFTVIYAKITIAFNIVNGYNSICFFFFLRS